MITLIQIGLRMIIVWYGMVPFTILRDGYIFLILFPIWSIAEVIRYAYYVTKSMDMNHPTLTWIRYSLPIILYPIGAIADFSTTYLFHDTIIETPILTRYDVYIMYFGIIMFPFGFPFMYWRLISQRRKVLSQIKIYDMKRKTDDENIEKKKKKKIFVKDENYSYHRYEKDSIFTRSG